MQVCLACILSATLLKLPFDIILFGSINKGSTLVTLPLTVRIALASGCAVAHANVTLQLAL